MKTSIPPLLLAHQQSGATSLAWAMRILRGDGETFGFTSADRDCSTLGDGVSYRADLGLDVSSIVSSAGFAVDNAEVTILADGEVFTRADILAGRWDGARFWLLRYNWAAPSQGFEVYKRGSFGTVQPRPGCYVTELRGLRQKLQQSIGNVTQPTCRNRLGDAKCAVALSDITETGTFTSVTSAQVFRDDARGEAADWFAEGELTFLDGALAGLTVKVKSYAADGTITLALPLIQAPEAGDAYSMVAGCRRRLAEDCVAKFSNALNFNGEPHVPGIDEVTRPPDFTSA